MYIELPVRGSPPRPKVYTLVIRTGSIYLRDLAVSDHPESLYYRVLATALLISPTITRVELSGDIFQDIERINKTLGSWVFWIYDTDAIVTTKMICSACTAPVKDLWPHVFRDARCPVHGRTAHYPDGLQESRFVV